MFYQSDVTDALTRLLEQNEQILQTLAEQGEQIRVLQYQQMMLSDRFDAQEAHSHLQTNSDEEDTMLSDKGSHKTCTDHVGISPPPKQI